MTSENRELFTVGPMRVGTADATITTNSSEFAAAAGWAFADLATASHSSTAERFVSFETMSHTDPSVRWSVHRDGEPCETELRHEAVLVHQQWELNRLAIESYPTSIHAAAVAIGGRTALLIGASHSGKTTLAGWLACHHGALYLTDEVASINADGQVLPNARPLGVRADSPLAPLRSSGTAGESAGSAAASRFMPDEQLMPISALGGTIGSAAVSVSLLVFPTFDAAADLSTEPVASAEAFERLALLTPGLTGHGRPVFDRLCRLVEDAEAIEVRYSDVREIAPVVASALAKVGRR